MLLAMRRDPALWLLVAILAAHGAIVLTHYRHPLITDEFYYVAKARYIVERHRFMPIDPHAAAAEHGQEWGNSDWRPPGYALVVAALSLGDFSDPAGALRFRVTLAQFLMVAAALLALYRAAVQAGVDGRARYAAAILLGLPPWTFGVVNEIGPDPENLALAAFALLALGRNRIVLGTFLLTLTLFFRPEMIVLPPIIVGIALLPWRRQPRPSTFSSSARRSATVPPSPAGPASSAACTSTTAAPSTGPTHGSARKRRRTTSSTRSAKGGRRASRSAPSTAPPSAPPSSGSSRASPTAGATPPRTMRPSRRWRARNGGGGPCAES